MEGKQFSKQPVVEALALKGNISSSAGESQLCSFVFHQGMQLNCHLRSPRVRSAQHTRSPFFPLSLMFTQACDPV